MRPWATPEELLEQPAWTSAFAAADLPVASWAAGIVVTVLWAATIIFLLASSRRGRPPRPAAGADQPPYPEAATGPRERERLLRAVSHDLKSELAGLVTVGDALLREGASSERLRSFVSDMCVEVRELAPLVDGLALLARNGVAAPLSRSGMVANDVLLDAVEQVRRQAETRGVRFEVQLHAGEAADGVLAGDADLLRTMLASLLRDALTNACPGARLEIRIAAAGGAIAFELHMQRPVGADGAHLRVRAAGGRVGLVVARRVAELHGGTVEVADDEGGRRVVARLPAAASGGRSAWS